MIVNSKVTVYHYNGLDVSSHFETWKRYNYDNVWFFGGQGAGINKGYDDANNFDVRIPYDANKDLSIDNFSIGDIVVQGSLDQEITGQDDLTDYITYNITSITNNNFGHNPHIHIGGK